MSKVYIRLKDRSTIFHDASQEVTLTGNQVKEAEKTGKVASAIKHGLLEEVEAPKEETTNQQGEPNKEAPNQGEPDKETAPAEPSSNEPNKAQRGRPKQE